LPTNMHFTGTTFFVKPLNNISKHVLGHQDSLVVDFVVVCEGTVSEMRWPWGTVKPELNEIRIEMLRLVAIRAVDAVDECLVQFYLGESRVPRDAYTSKFKPRDIG
jgi:hypothetical protein